MAKRVTDAVERRQAQHAYREIFEKVPDGIVVHDPADGSFVDMNRQYAELFGYDRDEFLRAGFEVIHPGESPYTVENAKRHIQEAVNKRPQTFEWPGVRKDGDQFWTEVHLTPVSLHGASRILAVVRDVTARTEREQELDAKDR